MANVKTKMVGIKCSYFKCHYYIINVVKTPFKPQIKRESPGKPSEKSHVSVRGALNWKHVKLITHKNMLDSPTELPNEFVHKPRIKDPASLYRPRPDGALAINWVILSQFLSQYYYGLHSC